MIQTDQGVKFFDPRVTRIDTVWLEGDTFLYVYFQDGKARKQTYMKAVHLGPTSVYLRNEVIQPTDASRRAAAKVLEILPVARMPQKMPPLILAAISTAVNVRPKSASSV